MSNFTIKKPAEIALDITSQCVISLLKIMGIFFGSKLKAFDTFFLSKGYHHEDIVSDNDYWKLSDDFRIFKKDKLLAIITLDYRDNLVGIDFSLVKIVKHNTVEFFTKKVGLYIYPDKNKNISLSNYDPINKSSTQTLFRDRVQFNNRSQVPALIEKQIAFLSENIADIEATLQFTEN